MNCRDADQRLEAWQLKSLATEEEFLVSQHLLSCERCLLQLKRIKDIENQIPQAFLNQAKPPRTVGFAHSWVVATALFLIAIYLGAQTNWFVGNPHRDEENVAAQISRQSADAKFERVGPRHIHLMQGELEITVKPSQDEFTVSTALGQLCTSHARFVVAMENKKMEAKTLVGAAGILTVGVAIGSVMFSSGEGKGVELGAGDTMTKESSEPMEVAQGAVIPRRNYGGESRRTTTPQDQERIHKLEAEVRELLQKDAVNKSRIAELESQKRKNEENRPKVMEIEDRPEKKVGPRDIAERLGLEPSREEALVQAYEQLQERIREQEKLHAKVEKTEDGYKIEIPEWPEDWKKLEDNWRRDLGGILMPQEMKLYESKQMSQQLFRDQGGNSNRSITITPGKEGYTVEESRRGKGMMMQTVADGIPTLDAALNGLSHLIDN